MVKGGHAPRYLLRARVWDKTAKGLLDRAPKGKAGIVDKADKAVKQ